MPTPTRQIFGSVQTLISSTTDIASGNFGAGGTAFDNQVDSAVPYATHALATIQMPDWGAAPAAGVVVELWGVLQDTDGTDDDTDAPSGTAANGARFFGAFPVAATDALQRRTVVISLEGVKKGFVPYLKNGSAQNMNNDGGTPLTLKVTPFSYGV